MAGIEPISTSQEDATTFELNEKKSSSSLLSTKTVSAAENENEDDTEWRKFGRFLGGTDARTRHRAVQRLGKFLQIKSGFGLQGDDLEKVVGLSELDLLKLWKGLWFTLYMADKVPVQDELAKQIAKLVWCLAGDLETDWIRCSSLFGYGRNKTRCYSTSIMMRTTNSHHNNQETTMTKILRFWKLV